jgi:hypothetical protein
VRVVDLPGDWPDAGHAARGVFGWNAYPAERRRQTSAKPETGFRIGWDEYAEYTVDPRKGIIDVAIGPIDEDEAAAAFILSVLPLILPLVALEPLHGAALMLPTGTSLLVVGASGSGKSTTAGSLRAHGLKFLADDACALDDDGRIWPGPPLTAAEHLVPDDASRELTRYDGKRIIEVKQGTAEPLPIGATAILDPSEGADLAVRSLSAGERIVEILRYVRAPWALRQFRERRQLSAATAVSRRPVGLVSFSPGTHQPGDVASAIAHWLEQAHAMESR